MKKTLTYLFSMTIVLAGLAFCKKNKEVPIDATINYAPVTKLPLINISFSSAPDDNVQN